MADEDYDVLARKDETIKRLQARVAELEQQLDLAAKQLADNATVNGELEGRLRAGTGIALIAVEWLKQRNADLAENARLREEHGKMRGALEACLTLDTIHKPICKSHGDGNYYKVEACTCGRWKTLINAQSALSTPPAEHGVEEGRKERAFDWLDKQRTIQISTVRESECLGNVREIIHGPTGEIHTAKTLLEAIEAAAAEGGGDDVAT